MRGGFSKEKKTRMENTRETFAACGQSNFGGQNSKKRRPIDWSERNIPAYFKRVSTDFIHPYSLKRREHVHLARVIVPRVTKPIGQRRTVRRSVSPRLIADGSFFQ